MASQQQPNAWQTASRSRNANNASNSNSNSASRTPQTRSGTQSPSQQTNPSQAPRQQDGPRAPPSQQQQTAPPNSVWTQRSGAVMSGSSNGKANIKSEGVPTQTDETYQSVNGFNAGEVKAFLGRDAGVGLTVYKPAEVPGAAARSGSVASNMMANHQPFFVQLAKQVATIEGGG